MPLRISVVMPTHNRARLLVQTLSALAAQSVPATEYEVILVADGCRDNTVQVAREMLPPFSLTVLEQRGSGAAVARNRGAERARSNLLLFLDDDMEAKPTLIEGHLEAHRNRPGSLVLGYFPILAEEARNDPFAKAAKEWWDAGFAARAHPAYRFSFWDFCTGNISLPTAVFRDAGGFCEDFESAGGEDWELGVRLLKQGFRFQFAPKAASIHHGLTDFNYALRRKRTEGLAHVLLARRHPELFWSLNLPYLSSLQHHRRLWRWLWVHPRLADNTASALEPIAKFCYRLGRMDHMLELFRVIEGAYYWRGVRRALPSAEAWETMMNQAPKQPEFIREVEIDVVQDWPLLDEILEGQHADCARLYFRGLEIGAIAPVPGGERLSPNLVRHEVATSHSRYLLMALMDSRGST